MYSTGGKTQSSEDLAEAAELQRPSLCGVVLAEATCERSDDHLALSLTDMAARAQQLLFGRPALLAMGLPCSGLLALVHSASTFRFRSLALPPPQLTLQTVEGKSRKEGQEPGQVVGQCTCHARPLLCPAQGGAIFSAAVLSSSALTFSSCAASGSGEVAGLYGPVGPHLQDQLRSPLPFLRALAGLCSHQLTQLILSDWELIMAPYLPTSPRCGCSASKGGSVGVSAQWSITSEGAGSFPSTSGTTQPTSSTTNMHDTRALVSFLNFLLLQRLRGREHDCIKEGIPRISTYIAIRQELLLGEDATHPRPSSPPSSSSASSQLRALLDRHNKIYVVSLCHKVLVERVFRQTGCIINAKMHLGAYIILGRRLHHTDEHDGDQWVVICSEVCAQHMAHQGFVFATTASSSADTTTTKLVKLAELKGQDLVGLSARCPIAGQQEASVPFLAGSVTNSHTPSHSRSGSRSGHTHTAPYCALHGAGAWQGESPAQRETRGTSGASTRQPRCIPL